VALSEWLQLMLEEIARKREEASRAEEEQRARGVLNSRPGFEDRVCPNGSFPRSIPQD
jgi:hypothetical protein